MTTAIKLANARAEYDRAQQECPHWDYEDDSGADLECCRRVLETRRTVRALRRKAQEER